MTGPMPFDKATTAPYHAVSNLYAGTCGRREANQNSLIFAALSQRDNIANLLAASLARDLGKIQKKKCALTMI
jgi:hypothetical protein